MKQLYPFQRAGVDFLVTHNPEFPKPHRALLDEMGLGKTPQACVALKEIEARSAFIACPKSIRETWADRLIEWGAFQPDEIHIIDGTKSKLPNHPCIIGNYETYRAPGIRAQIKAREFDACIIDEAKRLKGISSKTSNMFLGTRFGSPLVAAAQYKFYLDGTISPNGSPIELFPILRTNCPELIRPYDDFDEFGKYFCDGFEDDWGNPDYTGASNVGELHERISPFALRRTVNQVYPQLPHVVTEDVYLDIGEMPFDESTMHRATVQKEVGIRKVPYVIQYLKDRLEKKREQILIFVYHREVAEKLVAALAQIAPVSLVYGGQNASVRQQNIQAFLNQQSLWLVAQINVLGEAFDGLQFVCHNIVCPERDWVPGTYDQAVSRVRRDGQTEITRVTRLTAVDTIDEPITGVHYRKRKVMKVLLAPTKVKEKAMPTIESQLEGIQFTLNKILEGQSGKPAVQAPAKQEAKSEAPIATPTATGRGRGRGAAASKPAGPTLEEVKEAGTNTLNSFSKEDQPKARQAVSAVFAKYGAKSVSDVPEDKYAEAIEKLNEIDGGATSDDLLA